MAKATNPYLILFLAVILSVGGVWFLASNGYINLGTQQQLTQTKTCPDGTIVASGAVCPAPGGGGCEVNPSVVLTVTDALQPGTSVSASGFYRLNGVYTGSTSPTTKGTADILISAAEYVNTTLTGQVINCGSNQIAASLYSQASATDSIYNNAGTAVLTNAATGGANNETVGSTGGQYNWKYHLVGTDKKSTGPMLLVVDLQAAVANVSSVSLTPLTGSPSATALGSVPSGYVTQTSGGYSKAFLIPAIIGASSADYNLQVQAATGYLVSQKVYTRLYDLAPFVETDGSFNPGNNAFDSIGAAKYMTSQDYNFCINQNGAC